MAETGSRIAPDARFVLSAKDVVAETFPDETVAVNLATGRYYSLDLPSAVVDLPLPLGPVISTPRPSRPTAPACAG